VLAVVADIAAEDLVLVALEQGSVFASLSVPDTPDAVETCA
jgi:hypothetical protein